jgi:hypothetical protein
MIFAPQISYANGASLAGLTDVVEQIPDSLLALSSDQRRDFLFAISQPEAFG